jgi:hypothetical protein
VQADWRAQGSKQSNVRCVNAFHQKVKRDANISGP